MGMILGWIRFTLFVCCLGAIWAVFSLISDSPWGIALIAAWIVLMVVNVVRPAPHPR